MGFHEGWCRITEEAKCEKLCEVSLDLRLERMVGMESSGARGRETSSSQSCCYRELIVGLVDHVRCWLAWKWTAPTELEDRQIRCEEGDENHLRLCAF